ncbi:Uncharacterised protein [Acinetobacter baumannii]|nr:Uncharacterised protein [Acinetobacter baumannii]
MTTQNILAIILLAYCLWPYLTKSKSKSKSWLNLLLGVLTMRGPWLLLG